MVLGRIILLLLVCCLLSGCGQDRIVTLKVVMGLAEEEWHVMREDIFPVFEERHNCRIEAYQV